MVCFSENFTVYIIPELYSTNDGMRIQIEHKDKGEWEGIPLREEVDAAINTMHLNKAPRIDNMPAEIIINGGKELRDKLYDLVCKMYREEIWPEDMVTSSPKML